MGHPIANLTAVENGSSIGWRSLLAKRAGAMGDVLHQVGLTVNSPLDIREILGRLASLALEAVPADRCAVFMVDATGTKLIPALAISPETPDEPLWALFRALEPIELKADASRWEAVTAGRALAFPDVQAADFVPPIFSETFGVRSVLLMPLVANGAPQGLLSLDWSARHECCPDEISLIESLGNYAALAIRNAHLYERVEAKNRALAHLVQVAGAANSATSLRSVLELVSTAFEELLGTTHCSINLIDDRAPQSIRTVSVRGAPWFTADLDSINAVARDEIERVRDIWEKSPEPVIYPSVDEQTLVDRAYIPSGISSAAFFPLFRPGAPLGFIATGFPNGAPSQEEIQTGQALADLAATATTRAALHEEITAQLQTAEVLSRLSDVVAGTSEIAPALRRLTRALQPLIGIRVVSLAVSDRQLRETLGAQSPSKCEMEAIRSWRSTLSGRHGSLKTKRKDGAILIPVAHRRRVIGALRVTLDQHAAEQMDEDVVLALGTACAEVVHKACLRRELAESERRQAIASERDRIARDLHDCVGQLMIGMGLQLAQYGHEAPDNEWRKRMDDLAAVASQGSRHIREAIHSLLFLQVGRNGLVRALRDLAHTFQATTGIDVTFRVSGHARPLLSIEEDALFRLALEALRNVERHSEAGRASLVVAYHAREVWVSVSDDGRGLSDVDPDEERPGHYGLVGLRRMLGELGGDLEVTDLAPHGVRVEGRVRLRSVRRNDTDGSSGASGPR